MATNPLTILSLDPDLLSLSSPENNSTSNDSTPVITARDLEMGSTLSIFIDANCTHLVSSQNILSSEVVLNNISINTHGLVSFYGQLTLENQMTSCQDLNLSYFLDLEPPNDTSVSNVDLLDPESGTTSSNINPLIEGYGVENGLMVTLFNDVSCVEPVGNGVIYDHIFTVSDINYTPLIDDGIKKFYMILRDIAGNQSPCIDLNLSYQLDTTPPQNPQGWNFNNLVNGVTSGLITPQIVGNGLDDEEGGQIKIFLESSCTVARGSVTIVNGNFTVSNINFSNNGTGDGQKIFYGIIMDKANNSSSCTPLGLNYYLDSTAPVGPLGWTLSSPSVGLTSNDNTPQIGKASGMVEEDGSIEIYDVPDCDGAMIGSATVNGGAFLVTNILYALDGTQDGTKSFYTIIEDVYGNRSNCFNLNMNYLLDTVDPASIAGQILTSPTSGSTSNDYTPQVVVANGILEANALIKIFNDSTCTGPFIGSSTVSGGGVTVSNISYLSNGTNDGIKEFYSTITDVAGNESSCTNLALSYKLDTIPPSDPSGWSMTSPFAGVTSSDNTPIIEGGGLDSENGGSVKVYDHSGCSGSSIGSSTISNGSFAVSDINLVSDGTITLYGLISDSAGNNSSCVNLNLSYLLDATDPANPSGWTLSSPANGTTTNDITPVISGAGLATENGGFVNIYDSVACGNSIGSATIVAGSFSVSNIAYLNNGIDDGIKTFFGKITDVNGNSSLCINLSLDYLLDTVKPSNPSGWSMTSPTNGATSNDHTPQITGNSLGSENGGQIIIYDDVSCSDDIGSTTIVGGSFTVSNISYAIDGSDNGTKNFYGKIVDTSNNSSSCVSLGLSYLYDHTNPSDPSGWTLSNPNNGVTSSDVTPVVSGVGLNSESGGVVNIYGSIACNISIGSAVISSGNFTVSNISYLNNGTQDGAKTYFGKITDTAGNESNCVNLNLGYFVDTTDPSDPVGLSLASPVNGSTSKDITPEISGSGLAVENGSIIYIYDHINCTSVIGSATIAGGVFTVSDISYLNNGTQDGSKIFYGEIVDGGGNRSSCVNLSLGYYLDTTNPSNPVGWTMASPNVNVTSSDGTPEISGVGLGAINGGSVTIYDNISCAVPVGSAIVAGGNFTVTNISFLTNGTMDGTKNFYGKLTDIAGNSSNCVSLNLAYKLDTLSPSDPVGWSLINVTNGSTSGNFAPQIGISGLFSENKSIAKIYLDNCLGSVVGSATINNGNFTITNTLFDANGAEDGIKTFYGTLTDLAGNVSNCTDLSLQFELDTSIPSVSISVPLTPDFINNANKGSFAVSGECSENGRVVTVGATGGLSTTPSCTGNIWSTNLNFTAVGDGAITVTADHDNVALTSAPQAEVVFTKDTGIPNDPIGWTLASPDDGSTSSDYSPQISGVGLAGENSATILIYTAGACASSVGSAEVAGGIFTVSDIIFDSDGSEDGNKVFYGKITDFAGNASNCVDLTLGYQLDTILPSNPSGWTLATPNNGATSNDTTPQISGAGLAGENSSTITLYDASDCTSDIGTATIAGGSFTASNISYLANGTQDGNKLFYGKIEDSAGNSSGCVSLSLGYKLDTSAPANPTGWILSSPVNGVTSSNSSPQITGSGLTNENGGTITIYDAILCADPVGTATIAGGSFVVSNISYLANGTQDGTKTFYGKITDVAGNHSACVNLSLSYLLDTTLPSNPIGWTISSPNNGTTSNDNTPQIGGAGIVGENDSLINIYSSIACSGSIGSAIIGGGSFTVSNITYLNNGTQDGTKAFFGKITDTAGNSSSCIDLSLGYLFDATVPANPSGWVMSTPNSGVTSNDVTPQISGSGLAGENGGLVTIYDASGCVTPIGTSTISGGNFTVSNISYASNGTDDGTKSLYGKIVDVAGNGTACISLGLGYLLDTTAPANPSGWMMASPNSGLTSSDYTPQISGSGLSTENGSSVVISTTIDCSNPVGSALISGGIFTVSNIVYASNGTEDGSKIFYGKIMDSAGNSSACTNLNLGYLLDTTNPSDPSLWTMSSPNTGITSNDYTPRISKSGLAVENGSTVSIYDAPACASLIGSATIGGGSFTVSNISYATNGTADGTKVFYGKIVDGAGNGSNCVNLNLGYLLDTIAPSNPTGWSMSSPDVGATSRDNTPQISGTGLSTENGGVVTISNVSGCGSSVGSATISSGEFTVSNISYATNGSEDGTKTFYGMITDMGGNSSSCVALSLAYLFDRTPPTVSITTPISSDLIVPSNMSSLSVSGSCSENGRTVSISATGGLNATSTCSSGSYSTNLDFTSLSEGMKTINVNLSDIAGNSAETATVSLYKYTRSVTRSISCGTTFCCALLGGGETKCWGMNAYGQLGLGHTNNIGDNIGEMANNLLSLSLGTGRKSLSLSLGDGHTCSLLDSGDLKCWGNNSWGQLGQGHKNSLGDNTGEMGDNLSTINLGTNESPLYITNGDNTSCALLNSSSVKCWGTNEEGILGQGHTNSLGDDANEMGDNLSTIKLGTNKKVLDISVNGPYTTCVLLEDSTVKCWGYGGLATLGQGSTNSLGDNPDEMGNNLSTVNVGSSTKVIAVEAGTASVCVLLESLNLKCWGDNSFGELGVGHTNNIGDNPNEMGDNLVTNNLGSNRKALSIYAKDSVVCALLDNRGLKCWGKNVAGNLGQGHVNSLSDEWWEIGNNLSTINLGSNLIPMAVSLHEGGCVLLNDSTIKCWGNNSDGRLGQGHTNNLGDNPNELGDNLSPLILGTPSRLVRKVSAGENFSCAILDDGDLKCWGKGAEGRIGQGSTSSRGNTSGDMGASLSFVLLGTDRNVISISNGVNHSCALLDDGRIKCWGYGYKGRLGQGSGTDRGDDSNEMGDNLKYVDLGTDRFALKVSVGNTHSCALLDNNGLKCWGENASGQLGIGNTVIKGNSTDDLGNNLPYVKLSNTESVIDFTTNASGACVLLTNGRIKCFGSGGAGKLGQGNVLTLGDEPNEMGNNLSYIELGSNRYVRSLPESSGDAPFMCVILDDNTVKCWGSNGYGQLGLGHTDILGNNPNEMGDNLETVNVGLRKVIKLSLGEYSVCSLLDDSTVKCWGRNQSGQLGRGNTVTRGDNANEMGNNLSTVNFGSNRFVIDLRMATNGDHACAVLDNGTIKCWGEGLFGCLGQGDGTNRGDEPGEMGNNLSAILLW